jgi:23S rRNA pseudouridine2605 synthase
MRINRFIAAATGISRRQADKLIQGSKVFINDLPAQLSDHVTAVDTVKVDGKRVFLPVEYTTIILNKPVGYVCSRNGQGSRTVYDLIPEELKHLKAVGRLDKDSSGLLVMTDDGQLAHELTHPKFAKNKVYELELNAQLKPEDADKIEQGVQLDDGISRFLVSHDGVNPKALRVTMQEGRNRQIRRTFSALNYTVKKLHRTSFGEYSIGSLRIGEHKIV